MPRLVVELYVSVVRAGEGLRASRSHRRRCLHFYTLQLSASVVQFNLTGLRGRGAGGADVERGRACPFKDLAGKGSSSLDVDRAGVNYHNTLSYRVAGNRTRKCVGEEEVDDCVAVSVNDRYCLRGDGDRISSARLVSRVVRREDGG